MICNFYVHRKYGVLHIKSGEYNNFNNIIIKVTRIRHKLVKQGMTVKQVGMAKQIRGIF